MKQQNFKINRIVAVMLLTSVFTFAFVWTNSSATEQSDNGASEQKTTAEAGNQKTTAESKGNAARETSAAAASSSSAAITLRAERRGFPLLNLQDGKKFQTKYSGTDGGGEVEQSINAVSQGEPLTMTNADLNADGAADLIVGFANGGGGGHLKVYQGNPDTLSARTPEIFEAMRQGQFPAPFLPEARLIQIPVAPDFIGTGDFNRDGWKDIIAAHRGSNEIYLLAGNGKKSFTIERIEIAGRATAMLTENIDPLDNAADVAVAVAGDNAAALLVFDGAENAFAKEPKIYQLPTEATSLAIGQLDDADPLDILATGGGNAVIIHGAYPKNSEAQNEQTDALQNGQVEILIQGFDVAAARVGNFVWDRENRPEIALLTADGSVRILERGTLDKRPFTEAEYKQRPLKMRELMAQEEERRNLNYQPRQAKIVRQQWAETDNIQISAPLDGANRASGSSNSFFTSARMTPLGVEDLLVIDSASRKVQVLISNNEDLKKGGETFPLSASGMRAAVSFEAEGSPIAVLPMRLSVMNRPGIVLLDKESGEISFAPAAPAATFTVTKTADTYDGACNADCSFREALQAANASNTSDIIMLPAGTYTINQALGLPDSDTSVDPQAQQSGDWDVFYDTTITGAGQATTILQSAAAQPGYDRVLDAIQTGVGNPDLTISGVTIRNGRCRVDVPLPPGYLDYECTDGGGLRYAVDNLTLLTINDSTVTTNRTDVETANSASNGGGIFSGQSDANFTNVTITNNTAAFVTGGCTGATQCGGEGGGVFAGIRFTANPTAVTMTNCTITGNTANSNAGLGGRGGAYAGSPDSVTIMGGTFSNNIAFTDGGALRLFTPTTIASSMTSTPTISNNTARQNGGGIWSDPLANNNTPQTNTFTNVVMKGNVADSDGVIGVNNNNRGDGGAIFHGRGTLNLDNPTIGGAVAGEGNTAYDGGGIGRTYSQFQAAVFNASALIINNGGSIVGNQAINNGGGILNDATRCYNGNTGYGSASSLSVGTATAVSVQSNKARNHGGGIALINEAIPGSCPGSSATVNAAATLNNMTVRSNQADSDGSGVGDGGGLYQSVVLTGGGTTFTGNLDIGGSGLANTAVNGGGIRNNAGTVTIPASASITNNTATGTGGGISNAGTLSALSSPSIQSNIATGNGGGIFNSGTLGAITAPQINFNSAATGGGIFSSSGALSLLNGSVSTNTATTGKGGGIEHSGASNSTVTSVSINTNTKSGILITGAGSLDATSNTITGNGGDGIGMTGTGVGSHFNSNTIHSNTELGIDLSDNGVTPNDTNDVDTGPNNLQNFPVLNYVRRGDGVANVTLNAPNGKYRIQYYKNAICDPSGNGEGEVLMASQVVDITSVATQTFFSPALAFDSGVREQITATATHDANGNNNFDDDGSTSEFSACRKVNTLPTITPQAGNTRQQGSPSSNSQIATVADPDQTLNTLVVTVNGGASATVNGVTLSNIVVSAGGLVTADIVASCTATNANFTLRVTDNATEFNEATLTVNVTANTAPTVGNYPNTTVNAGSSGTIVTPSAAPTDNGSIATVTAVATTPAGFTGTFSGGNTTTGAVTINNAAPFGVYTVTVTTTDNCGATTPKTFTLTVNAIPTISPQAGVTRQQGSPATNSQIATVNDADQTANTLVVTIRAVGGAAPGTGTATVNGVTVSNIAVTAAGVVTADVVAACGATTPANFTLRVTDSNGAFTEATLSVTVTANTAPSVGTYANTTLPSGGGTTVTPTFAPTDNGSVATATAAAPGFTGTFSVSTSTGVVTIANAGPAGAFTVTVTFTDNCTLATTRTFTLTVVAPPTIAKSFSPTSAFINGISTLTITITNPAANTVALTGVGVTDTFPAGLQVDATPGATNSCATGTFAPVAAATSISISGATIPVNTACTFSVKVRGTTAGAKLNTTGNVTSTNGGSGGTASATLTVNSLEADVDPPPSGNGLVQSSDVVQMRLFLNCTGIPNAMTDEFQRADSSPFDAATNTYGDGKIQSDDVVQARRYQNMTDAPRAAAGPTGPVVPRCGQPAAPLQAGKQSEQASNTVEETGQVPQTVAAPDGVLRQLRVQNASTGSPSQVTVNILADAAGDEAGYGFTINYVTSILTNPVVAIGTAGGVQSCNTTTSPGQIFCGVDNFPTNRTGNALIGEIAPGSSQVLITVTFTVPSGITPQMTNVTLTDVNASRDTPPLLLSIGSQNGTVTITGSTAATVSIGGRVTATNGRGINRAVVTITNGQGQIKTVVTDKLGNYRFTDVEVGQTYVVGVKAKQYNFSQSSQLLNVNDEANDINFVGSAVGFAP